MHIYTLYDDTILSTICTRYKLDLGNMSGCWGVTRGTVQCTKSRLEMVTRPGLVDRKKAEQVREKSPHSGRASNRRHHTQQYRAGSSDWAPSDRMSWEWSGRHVDAPYPTSKPSWLPHPGPSNSKSSEDIQVQFVQHSLTPFSLNSVKHSRCFFHVPT